MNWPWEVLGLSGSEDLKEIRQAYHGLLQSVHPEVDPEGFQTLHQAYQEACRLVRAQKSGQHPFQLTEDPVGLFSGDSTPDAPKSESSEATPLEEGWDFDTLLSQVEQYVPHSQTSSRKGKANHSANYRHPPQDSSERDKSNSPSTPEKSGNHPPFPSYHETGGKAPSFHSKSKGENDNRGWTPADFPCSTPKQQRERPHDPKKRTKKNQGCGSIQKQWDSPSREADHTEQEKESPSGGSSDGTSSFPLLRILLLVLLFSILSLVFKFLL